jgi:hypothetical protein
MAGCIGNQFGTKARDVLGVTRLDLRFTSGG